MAVLRHWRAVRALIVVIAVVLLAYLVYGQYRERVSPLDRVDSAEIVGFYSGPSEGLLHLVGALPRPSDDLTPFLQVYAESRAQDFEFVYPPTWTVAMRMSDGTYIYVNFFDGSSPMGDAQVVVYPGLKPENARQIQLVRSGGLAAAARRLATPQTDLSPFATVSP